MTQNIILEGVLSSGRSLNVVMSKPTSVYLLKKRIYSEAFISPDEYFLTSDGVCLEDSEDISCSHSTFKVLRVHLLLLGGKGGFGTLIRAMGTQINKGSRKGACRDLSGRRMRDVDAEKKLAKWMAQEPERKKKCMEHRRRKLERRRNQPKHQFNDSSYMAQIRSAEESIDTALQQGLKARPLSTSVGESSETSARTEQGIWVGVDDYSGESCNSDAEEPDVVPEGKLEMGDCRNSLSPRDVGATSSNSCEVPGPSVSADFSSATSSIDEGSMPVSSSQIQVVHVKDNEEGEEKSGVILKIIDVEEFSSVEELVSVDGNTLKYTLQSMGLKCGGTVMERAQRLFSTKGKSMDEIDRSLFAKNKKWKTMRL